MTAALLFIISITVAGTFTSIFGKYSLPRKAKKEIPITYNIGWWSYQDKLKIDDFKVEIEESKLNLFNTKTLISYTVKGQLKYEGYWKPFIKEVHISERVFQQGTVEKNYAEIQVTPIVDVKEDKSQNGGTVNFEFKNEHSVKSMHWGENTIRLTCAQFEKTITLTQKKESEK